MEALNLLICLCTLIWVWLLLPSISTNIRILPAIFIEIIISMLYNSRPNILNILSQIIIYMNNTLNLVTVQ